MFQRQTRSIQSDDDRALFSLALDQSLCGLDPSCSTFNPAFLFVQSFDCRWIVATGLEPLQPIQSIASTAVGVDGCNDEYSHVNELQEASDLA